MGGSGMREQAREGDDGADRNARYPTWDDGRGHHGSSSNAPTQISVMYLATALLMLLSRHATTKPLASRLRPRNRGRRMFSSAFDRFPGRNRIDEQVVSQFD